MAALGRLAVACERNSVERDPIQEMLRGRSVGFLSAGTCPGYQEEVASCGWRGTSCPAVFQLLSDPGGSLQCA